MTHEIKNQMMEKLLELNRNQEKPKIEQSKIIIRSYFYYFCYVPAEKDRTLNEYKIKEKKGKEYIIIYKSKPMKKYSSGNSSSGR